MKAIKIGNKEYQQIEDLFDMGDERFVMFKQYISQSFEKLDNPSFLIMFNRVIKNFNSNDVWNIVVELTNFKKTLELKELNYDCFSICFALLHIKEGEDLKNISADYQLSKLQEMRDEGLSRGLVEEVVENFMKAHPKHFSYYLEVLQMMRYLSKEEISNALVD